jgi:hypothetical protein
MARPTPCESTGASARFLTHWRPTTRLRRVTPTVEDVQTALIDDGSMMKPASVNTYVAAVRGVPDGYRRVLH